MTGFLCASCLCVNVILPINILADHEGKGYSCA